MTYTIPKGKHRGRPLKLGLWYGKRRLHKCLCFLTHQDEIAGADAYDTSKLFGIGYLWNHHKHSARFGFVYNKHSRRYEIYAYVYDNGNRTIKYLADCEVGNYYQFAIIVMDTHYLFTVYGHASTEIPHSHKKKWSYPLGIYFGGNKPAPNELKIEMK
jgi:hypothetical protein